MEQHKMDTKGLEFHVVSGDYFGTLATILELMRADMEKKGFTKKNNALLERLCEELMYLEQRYVIHKK